MTAVDARRCTGHYTDGCTDHGWPMSTADERLAELLDRWLTSVELHARYLELDDDAYARLQDWPRHQRPSRWVIELARTRIGELRRLLEERSAGGDTGFAEGLELMAFLTTLLGSEHVERFIPLAQPQTGRQESPRGQKTVQAEQPAPASVPPARTATPPSAARVATRPGVTPRPIRPTAATRRPPQRSQPPVSPREPEAPSAGLERATATVVADAVRLLNWGREWPQLAGLIARLADRPSEQDIWRILRRHRATIEAQARRRID